MQSIQTIEVPLETYNELLEIERKYLLLKKEREQVKIINHVSKITEGSELV